MSEASELTRKVTGQHIAEVSLRAAAERGALKATHRGGVWVTTPAALRAYLKGRPSHFREAARQDTSDTSGRKITLVKKPSGGKSVKMKGKKAG